MADLASLRISVDSTQVKGASGDLNQLAGSAKSAEGATNSLSRASDSLRNMLKGLGIGYMAAEAVKMADAYNKITSQIRLVTDGAAQLAAVQEKLFAISNTTRTSFESTTELYARMARSAKSLGASQNELLIVTNAINKASVVSGASSTEANAALIQLAQGFASGTLRGDELNSVLEQMPRVAKMIADGMGISVGQLRTFGAQGKLTSQEVFNSIIKMAGSVDAEFAKMPMTVGQSLSVLKNYILKFVGDLDSVTGFSNKMAQSIIFLATHLTQLAAILSIVAARFAAVRIAMTGSMIASYITQVIALERALGAASATSALFSAALKGAQRSFLALTASMMTNPFVAIATAIASVIAILFNYRNEQFKIGAESVTIGNIVIGAWEKVKDAFSYVTSFMAKIWDTATGSIKAGWNSVAGFIGNVLSVVFSYVKSYINNYIAAFVGLWKAAKAIFSDKSIKSEFLSAFREDYVGGFADDVKRGLVALNQLGASARDAGNAVDLSAKSTAEALSAKAKKTKDELKHFIDYIKGLNAEAATIGKNAIDTKIYEVSQKLAELKANSKINGDDKALLTAQMIAARNNLINAMQSNMVTEITRQNLVLEDQINTFHSTIAEAARLAATREGMAKGLKGDYLSQYVDASVAKANLEDLKNALQKVKDMTFEIDLTSVFGNFGKAFGGILNSLDDFIERQKEINKVLAGSAKGSSAWNDAASKSLRNQVNMYGNLASSAKGFFSEGSDGYKALETAETAFRAMELANALKNAAIKMGLITAETGTLAASESAKTGATMAGETARTGVALAQAAIRIPVKLAEGAASMFASLGPLGFAAVAAMGAVMAAYTVGGAGRSANTNKYNTGTGTVFGDSGAKSESITKALDALNQTSDQNLLYSSQMAASLRNIESAMTGVTNIILRSSGLSNFAGGIQTGYGGFANDMSSIMKKIPLNVFAGLWNTLFGSKTTMLAQGIYGAGQNMASILADGFKAQYFADTTTAQKAFGITVGRSYSTQFAAADEAINRQFTMIFENIYNAVSSAAIPLGVATSDVTSRLNAFVVEIGKIDTTGLTGTQLQEKISAVFNAAADNIAQAAIPSLEKFQKIGEGYFETLMRVANTVESVRYSLEKMGYAAVVTIDSVMSLTDMFGSLSDYTSAIGEFFNNFYSDSEKLKIYTNQLTDAFANLGLTMPATLAGYRDLVNGLDLNTAAGQATYKSLIDLSSAFYDVSKLQEQAASDYKALQDDLRSAYQNQADGLQNTIDKFKQFSETLRSFRDSLYKADAGAIGYKQALVDLISVGSLAASGDVTALGNLQGVSQTFLTASKAQASSAYQYQRDVAMVASYVDQAIVASDAQASVAQQQLDLLTAQVSQLVTLNETAQTVAEAISALLGTGYQPQAQIAPVAAYSPETTGGVLVSTDTATQLSATNTTLSDGLYQIAKNTGKTFDLMDRWDGDGLPDIRESASDYY